MTSNKIYSLLWAVVSRIVFFFIIVLAAQAAARISFPWDVYLWSESPFLTNLLKLDHHLPIFGPPADANSFVYAPGLEYICYAILKPFGLELDIRFCRIISVAFGVLAAACGAWLAGKAARPADHRVSRTEFFVGLGVILLVSSRSMTWDICHPDNLHAFHALSLFCLCFAALETKRYSLAVASLIWAGAGVFTKQTEAVSILGPALIFARYNPWGWKRWFLAVISGAIVLAISLYLLWRPQYGRFYTFQVLSHHQVYIGKLLLIYMDFIFADRGLLLYLAIIAGIHLWTASEKSRRYVTCWLCLGIFCVLPNVAAFVKENGTTNNLIPFEIWAVMLVWPFFLNLVDTARQPEPDAGKIPGLPSMPVALSVLFVLLLLLLFPLRGIPRPEHYQYCQTIENLVRKDREAGLKVLVSHGTEYLIRAGITNVPLDRCNSVLELDDAGMASAVDTGSRLRAHYYDRIYLVRGVWYGEKIYSDLRRNYALANVVQMAPTFSSNPFTVLTYGFQATLMEDCQVLVPIPAAAAGHSP
jgi:hypothetical protein